MTHPGREPSDEQMLENLRATAREDPDEEQLELAVRRALIESTPRDQRPDDGTGLSDQELLRNLRDQPAQVERDLANDRMLRELTDGSRKYRRRTAPLRRQGFRSVRPGLRPAAPPGGRRTPLGVPEPTPMEEALLSGPSRWDDPDDHRWVGAIRGLQTAVEAWTRAGFTPEQVREWRKVGVRGDEVEIALALLEYGFNPTMANTPCRIVPYSYRTAVEAVRAGVPLEHVRDACQR
jgi:hypothetical protein